jgi:hypothetical protein
MTQQFQTTSRDGSMPTYVEDTPMSTSEMKNQNNEK